MSTIAEIRSKIKALQTQEAEMIAKEKAAVIDEIKKKIADFKITSAELGLGKMVVRKTVPTTAPGAVPVVKYRKGDLTWSGGRGPKPGWVKELIASGGDIEQFKI